MFYRPHSRRIAPHSEVMMTKQEFKDECDINNILKQYQKTGIIAHINRHEASFQDLPDHFDYQEAVNTVMAAEASFADLPSKVRDHFGNDPHRFLEAFQDPEQHEYLRSVNLLKPLPPAEGSRLPQAPSAEGELPTPRRTSSAPSSTPRSPAVGASSSSEGKNE